MSQLHEEDDVSDGMTLGGLDCVHQAHTIIMALQQHWVPRITPQSRISWSVVHQRHTDSSDQHHFEGGSGQGVLMVTSHRATDISRHYYLAFV